MSNGNFTTKLTYLMAGAGIGGILMLLFAPRSGKETRKLIADKTEDGKDFVVTKTREFRKQAVDFAGRGKDAIAKQKDRLADAFSPGH